MTLLPLAGVQEAADHIGQQVAEKEAQAKAGALDAAAQRGGRDGRAARRTTRDDLRLLARRPRAARRAAAADGEDGAVPGVPRRRPRASTSPAWSR